MDGGFRDSGKIANLAIPSFHQRASAPTNLTLHQAIDINVPIGCGDVAVFPGDVLVGDDDGVIVIPQQLVDEVSIRCTQMTLYEDFVLEKVQMGASIIGLYPLTNSKLQDDFEIWKSSKS